MRPIIKISTFFLLVLTILFSLPLYASAEENSEDYKIVFAVDTSGSMCYSDPNQIRLDALSMFLGILPDQTCSVGCLTFNTDIVKSCPLQSTGNRKATEKVLKCVRNSPDDGDTAIGIALSYALKILKVQEEKPEPHSAVIILTDGKDDYINSDYTDKEYNHIKSNAIKLAEKCNVSVYTVAIDTNDTTNTNDLAEFSTNKTEPLKVSKASELKEAFQSIYNSFFPVCTPNELLDGKTTDKKYKSKNFIIPRNGIKDTNIIITSDRVLNENPISRIEMNDTVINKGDLSKLTVTEHTVSVTKLPNTYAGVCTVYYNKNIQDNEISVIYNDCINAEISGLSNAVYFDNHDIDIYAIAFHDGNRIVDDISDDYTLNAVVVSKSDSVVSDDLPDHMTYVQNNGQYHVSLPKNKLSPGEYSVKVVLHSKYTNRQLQTDIVPFCLINRDPVFLTNEITREYRNEDFLTIDLSEIIYEPDGDQLSIISPGNKIIKEKGTYKLQAAIPKGRDDLEIKIIAQDDNTGKTVGLLTIHWKPIEPISLEQICIIILVILILFALFFYFSRKPLYIEIKGTRNGEDIIIPKKIRAFAFLKCFGLDMYTIHRSARFILKKDHVILIYRKDSEDWRNNKTKKIYPGEQYNLLKNEAKPISFIISVKRTGETTNE
jgi:hypothetical protein